MTTGAASPLIPCVGAVIQDDQGRLLLVQRAHDPGRGRWSLPGGRVEPGEDDAAAVIREVHEETGLDVVVGKLVGEVRIGSYLVHDYRCTVVGGELRAGSDAAAARYADPRTLPTTPGLIDTLLTWGVLAEAR